VPPGRFAYIEAMNSAVSAPNPALRPVATWLLVCAAMVFAMVVLGGATRLTESGLSMVEWKPLHILPPLNDQEWTEEFTNYQQYPEYQKVNSWMTVDDFKSIYWLEYSHRLWGRLIGFVFFVPFVWFLYKGVVRGPLVWKLAGLFALGGAQGAMGWFMVASGLVDRPDVSQYRLAAHLILAFIVYGLLIWVALDLFRAARGAAPATSDPVLSRLGIGIAGAVLLVVVTGAFVAGLDAGLIYNTFPLMDGSLIPRGLYELQPWWRNWFENIMTVQFNHRLLAIALVTFIVLAWLRVRKAPPSPRVRKLMTGVVHMSVLQAALGISTLLLVVPLPLALAHQAGALILFTLAVCLAHEVHAPAATVAVPHLNPAE
jgi:cytochrome c oxidase assembly protein subunit 15